MKTPREIRIRQIPKAFNGGKWSYDDQPLVHLGDVGRWSVVRHADYPAAAPFVISRKDWDKLPVKTTTPSNPRR